MSATPQLKEAARLRARAWYKANRARALAAAKARYRALDAESHCKINARQRALYAQRTDSEKEAERRRKREHAARTNRPQRRKAYNADYIRRYNIKHKARLAAQKKAYAEAHKEKIAAYQKQWRAQNQVRLKAAHDKRRALKKAAAVNLKGIRQFVSNVRSKPFSTCYYCEARVPSSEVHFDHIVALSKGGPHSVENLCVSCSACNLSKGAKSLLEWGRDRAAQQLLNL